MVTAPMLRLLKLRTADKAVELRQEFRCSRCRKDARPRRLWSCSGRELAYAAICFECVRWVGARWRAWLDRRKEPVEGRTG